jgi:hypothetical protein
LHNHLWGIQVTRYLSPVCTCRAKLAAPETTAAQALGPVEEVRVAWQTKKPLRGPQQYLGYLTPYQFLQQYHHNRKEVMCH